MVCRGYRRQSDGNQCADEQRKGSDREARLMDPSAPRMRRRPRLGYVASFSLLAGQPLPLTVCVGAESIGAFHGNMTKTTKPHRTQLHAWTSEAHPKSVPLGCRQNSENGKRIQHQQPITLLGHPKGIWIA
ncbi:hypothetical protein ACLOJK_003148 [Asimina triloba]